MGNYIWTNIRWKSNYNSQWDYNGEGQDSDKFKNLQQCFLDVFGLQLSFYDSKYTFFYAFINDDGYPTIRMNSNTGCRLKLSRIQQNTLHTIKMMRYGSDAATIQRDADAEGNVMLIGLGGTHGGNDTNYYFGEIGIGQAMIGTYLFNNEQLDSLNSKISPYLKDTIELVKGPATDSNGKVFDDDSAGLQTYASVQKDYESSVTNSIISKELLDQIGVNKITIPRYKISEGKNEYHFEGLSFPSNRVQMTNEEKETGQFCHNGDMQLSSSQVDAKYWSTTPHIYPEIIFNNTVDYDAVRVDGIFNSLRMHTIVKNATTITIDDISMPIRENDKIICYIRSQGNYQSQLVPSISDRKLPLDKNIEITTNLSGTSKIEFDNIQMYDITNSTINQSFSASTEYKGLFSETPITNSLYGSIITTRPQWSINMPSISGADVGYKGAIISTLGTYSYSRNWLDQIKEDTISLQKELLFSSTCDIHNFQCISTNQSDPTLYNSNEASVDCYVHEPKSSLHKMDFFTTSTWIVGSFPKNMGFFGNVSDEKVEEKDSFMSSTKETYRMNVEDLDYDSYYNYWNNSTSINGSSTVSETHNLKLKVGFVNRLQTNTFAMAIVVWRNGKLCKELS